MAQLTITLDVPVDVADPIFTDPHELAGTLVDLYNEDAHANGTPALLDNALVTAEWE